MLRLKAKEFCNDPEFKASVGWYVNWKRRHSITLRTKTTLAQRLPNDLEEKMIQFHRFIIIIAAHHRHGYSLSRIFNMDETPMRFEMPSSQTLEFSGSRTVPVKSCGAEKRSFTVTLAVAADGKKLPPKMIFKGVRTPRDLVVPESVRVSFHKKGWMDETGVKEWIQTCLPRNPTDERSLLVWDSFRAHLTDAVKEALHRRKIDVAVIPRWPNPSSSAFRQVFEHAFQGPHEDKISVLDGNWPLRVHSRWEKESSIEKSGSTLDKKVME